MPSTRLRGAPRCDCEAARSLAPAVGILAAAAAASPQRREVQGAFAPGPKPKIHNVCVSSSLDPKPLKITFGGGDREGVVQGLLGQLTYDCCQVGKPWGLCIKACSSLQGKT